MNSILVVDDNLDACHSLAKLLTLMGDRAKCVISGEAAIEYLKGHTPCLVILDEMMPGMNGIEVLRNIRGNPRTAHIPVIMFTAIGDPEFAVYAKREGATDYWTKGKMDFSTLHQLVAPYVGGLAIL